MPNWVFTTVSVHGDQPEVEDFVRIANEPIEYMYHDFINVEDGGTKIVEKIGIDIDPVFSFRNFVPTVDGDNWYEDHLEKWGTKWDAVRPELMHKEPTFVQYRFDTAWSPAEPVFAAICTRFPNLSFTFFCEEEQGWGVEYSGDNGVLTVVEEWDIPQSHADYDKRERDCMCEMYPDEVEYHFSDCPTTSLQHAHKETVDATQAQ